MSLAGQLTVRGGTGYVIEYYGPGIDSLSCTGMATICNMGAEVGATTSVFPFSRRMIPYLESTHRASIALKASGIASTPSVINLLRADDEASYDEVITISLDTLEPHINGPFTPDLSTPLSQFAKAVEANQWPRSVSAGLIGSCTNSSYQDMTRAEHIVKQASAAGLLPMQEVSSLQMLAVLALVSGSERTVSSEETKTQSSRHIIVISEGVMMGIQKP
jgi:homoaconitase